MLCRWRRKMLDDDDDLDIDEEDVSDRCAKQICLKVIAAADQHAHIIEQTHCLQSTAIDCRSAEDKDEDNQRQLLELHQRRKEERQLFKRWKVVACAAVPWPSIHSLADML